jgi:hypothetical protein
MARGPREDSALIVPPFSVFYLESSQETRGLGVGAEGNYSARKPRIEKVEHYISSSNKKAMNENLC